MGLLYGSYDELAYYKAVYDEWAHGKAVMMSGPIFGSYDEWAYCMAVMMSGPNLR